MSKSKLNPHFPRTKSNPELILDSFIFDNSKKEKAQHKSIDERPAKIKPKQNQSNEEISKKKNSEKTAIQRLSVSKSLANFNQFLSKIEIFQKAKNEKILCLKAIKKQQEEDEISKIPKVKMLEKSKKILENKQSQRVSSPVLKKTVSEINIRSAQKLNQSPSLSKIIQPKSSSELSAEQVLQKNFIKEYLSIFDMISKGKICINKDETRKILASLGFLSTNSQSLVKQDIEEKLFAKMWKISGSEETSTISIDSLKTFLMALMNFFVPSMSHNLPGVQFGRVLLGRFYVNQEEAIKIHQIFTPLYENRTKHSKQSFEFEKISKSSMKSLNKYIYKGVSSPAKGWASYFKRNCITPGRKSLDDSASSPNKLKDDLLFTANDELLGVSVNKISDPSIISRAQNVLENFSKTGDKTKETSKSEIRLFNKRKFDAKEIDEGIKKVKEILEKNKKNDEIFDVHLPDGTHKTLIIPEGPNRQNVILKFIKDNKLSKEMERSLIMSINNP